jgi:hypothetical protein
MIVGIHKLFRMEPIPYHFQWRATTSAIVPKRPYPDIVSKKPLLRGELEQVLSFEEWHGFRVRGHGDRGGGR